MNSTEIYTLKAGFSVTPPSPTQPYVPERDVVGEAELGLEDGQDLEFDLVHGVTAERLHLQRLAELPVAAHHEHRLQLLRGPHNHTTMLSPFPVSSVLGSRKPISQCFHSSSS